MFVGLGMFETRHNSRCRGPDAYTQDAARQWYLVFIEESRRRRLRLSSTISGRPRSKLAAFMSSSTCNEDRRQDTLVCKGTVRIRRAPPIETRSSKGLARARCLTISRIAVTLSAAKSIAVGHVALVSPQAGKAGPSLSRSHAHLRLAFDELTLDIYESDTVCHMRAARRGARSPQAMSPLTL